jgi:hypothetical protein
VIAIPSSALKEELSMSSKLHPYFLWYQTQAFPSSMQEATCLLANTQVFVEALELLEGKVKKVSLFKGKRNAGARTDTTDWRLVVW